MQSFIRSMQSIDRRWIYLVLAVTLIVSLLMGHAINPSVAPPAQQLFDAVNAAPAGPGDHKIILVGMTFAGSTLGENGNQARAILRHLMLAHKRFAVISVGEPQGAEFGKIMGSEIAKQYGYKYGTDWISFDFQVYSLAFYKTFLTNVPLAIGVDGIEKKPITDFPIMQGIKTANDVSMLIEIASAPTVWDWVQIVQPATQPRMKIGYACTGIMVSEAYQMLDSGQIVGLLPGLKGAADYEMLVDQVEQQQLRDGKIAHAFDMTAPSIIHMPRSARKLMFTQNTAHIMLILFILLGNLGLLMSVLASRKSVKKEDRHD